MGILFRVKSTYYSFLSGAISSFSFSIIYDAAKVGINYYLWISGFVMLLSSLLVIIISVKVDQSLSVYEANKVRSNITHKPEEQYFYEAIIDNKRVVLVLLVIAIFLFGVSIVLFTKGCRSGIE